MCCVCLYVCACICRVSPLLLANFSAACSVFKMELEPVCTRGVPGEPELMGYIPPSSIANTSYTMYTFLINPQRQLYIFTLSSVQSLSHVRLCDPTNRSTPGLPVHHQLPEFTQTHVHPVSDAIQPSHPLSSPSPPTPNPSQHQSFPVSQLFT